MRIGISKGRIEEVFYKRLIDKNIINDYDKKSRTYEIDIDDYEIYSLKSCDIIPLLNEKCIDIGILGSDVIEEYNSEKIEELGNFDTGKCSFMIAALPGVELSSIKRVATKYPRIASYLLKSINLECEIKKMNGSIEIAPKLDYADAIIDLVETGNTLKANGLVELYRFDYISTRIISRKEDKNKQKIRKFVKNMII